MSTHVAFLRGINVGGHTVEMDVLRKLFEEIGLADISTFIASGNVLFATRTKSLPPLERKIERRLHDALGYEVATFIRTHSEIRRIAKATPFADVSPKPGDRVHVGFVHKPPSAATRRSVLSLASDRDHLHLKGRELFWLSRGPISESPLGLSKLERALAGPTTMRNVTSVERLVAKLG
ncbi:MAG: DUF1697 domain-containing protein [Acidimicrobiia bacterium]